MYTLQCDTVKIQSESASVCSLSHEAFPQFYAVKSLTMLCLTDGAYSTHMYVFLSFENHCIMLQDSVQIVHVVEIE